MVFRKGVRYLFLIVITVIVIDSVSIAMMILPISVYTTQSPSKLMLSRFSVVLANVTRYVFGDALFHQYLFTVLDVYTFLFRIV